MGETYKGEQGLQVIRDSLVLSNFISLIRIMDSQNNKTAFTTGIAPVVTVMMEKR